MSDDKPTCYWRGAGEGRAIKDRHADDCNGEHCRGCLPCPERHCICCGMRHSLDQTCPTCLHDTREDLDVIAHIISTASMRSQALNGSTLSGSGAVKPAAASAIPGGEAMVILGPTNDAPDDHELVYYAHPATVLASWSQDWTESGATHRHPLNDDDVTWAAKHHPAFDDFAREMRQLRTQLEDTFGDGERKTTGAPCEVCGRPLEFVWASKVVNDRWWCDRCKKSLDPAEYVEQTAKAARKNKTWLTSRDMEAEYRIPRGTLTRWASERHVRKRLDINLGRQVYSVDDALGHRNRLAEDESA